MVAAVAVLWEQVPCEALEIKNWDALAHADDDKIQFSKMGLTVITMGLLADFQVPVLQSAFGGVVHHAEAQFAVW